jgi:hypothetical protein
MTCFNNKWPASMTNGLLQCRSARFNGLHVLRVAHALSTFKKGR